MIGDKVQDLAQPVSFHSGHHPIEGCLVPQFGIERVMVNDIVSVRTSWPRFQPGRRVDVADTQPGQVRSELCGLVKSKILVKLQPVGRARGH